MNRQAEDCAAQDETVKKLIEALKLQEFRAVSTRVLQKNACPKKEVVIGPIGDVPAEPNPKAQGKDGWAEQEAVAGTNRR
jgi:hypothetical protein